MNGAQWLVKALKNVGVERLFTLCGNGLDPVYDACFEEGIGLLDTRNEQAASYMGDAWGRLTRKIGAVAVSAGPGHTNALTGLANAFWDGGPMLLISGCSPADSRGMGHFQELDQAAMAAPACKYARFVDRIETLPQEVNNALQMAVSGRPGPVHLTIPADVLLAPLPEGGMRTLPGPLAAEPRIAGDPEWLRQAVLLLREAKRPFIVVGSGAFYAGAGEVLKRFAGESQIPVLSHLWDRGCVDAAWPQYVGTASGEVNGAFHLLSEADVVLFLGARLDYRVNHGLPPMIAGNARIIRIDAEPSEIHRPRPVTLGIVADPKSALEGMVSCLQSLPFSHQDWLTRVRSAREGFLKQWDRKGQDDSCPLSALRICQELQPFLDRDVTFLLDGGNIGRWAHMLLWNRHPAHWLTCGASGAVGWGLPGAVAARLSRPDHPVLILTGDGAAGFTLADIETALRFKTPYVAVVAHDAAWGVVADHRPEDYKDATLLGEIRFDKVAAALGARGVFVEHASQLGPAIAEGLQAETVTFIHVPTQLGGIAQWARKWGL